MSQLAINIEEISKFYNNGKLQKIPAVKALSLQVPRGEVFGFLGPNGAGKTTLIKMLVGVLNPSSGSCSIFDESGTAYSSRSRQAKSKLGYLPERPYFHDFLTADEFLVYHGRLMGMENQEIQKRIPMLLDKLGLAHARNQKLKTFSKGMLQRVGFAQALIHDPELLVLDEPMSGLDPVGRREIRDIIGEVAKLGKTIFFSTHIIHDVEVICTTVGFIQKGTLEGMGNIESLLGKTLKSMEVRFTADSPESIKELKGSRKTMDGWVLDIETDPDELEQKVNKVISKIIETGGMVRSVVPRKSTLEDLFFKEE